MNIFQRALNSLKRAAEKFTAAIVPKPTKPSAPYMPEAEALRRATEILITAEEHAGDAIYERARQEALTYINKSQRLAGLGKQQRGNRIRIAERYLKSELSSAAGIDDRKQRKLEIFNSNFGLDLSESQAQTVGKLMESTSFKKLMETFKERYDILIGMVGQQVEEGVDPERISAALDLWQGAGLDPDFTDFAKVTDLSNDDFLSLQEDLTLLNEESYMIDEFKKQEAAEGILGRYISW